MPDFALFLRSDRQQTIAIAILFIFVNGAIDKSSATVDFTINPAQYGIPSNYQLYRRSINGNPATTTDTVVGNFSQGSLTKTMQLQPLEIVTYVAKS